MLIESIPGLWNDVEKPPALRMYSTYWTGAHCETVEGHLSLPESAKSGLGLRTSLCRTPQRQSDPVVLKAKS